MKIVKKILIVLLLALVVIQFFRPEKNVSDPNDLEAFITQTRPPKDVQIILKTACYDCHTNNTEYPWYAEVAPISFWLDDHIKHGKGHLNFSEWDTYSNKKKDHKLEELIEEVKSGAMPLDSYTWVHGDAKLTKEQTIQLLEWAETVRFIYQLGVRPQ